MLKTFRRIVCKDGASVSVQAGRAIYCTPRNDQGPWTHLEAGFPSVAPPESWLEYMDGDGDPLEQVYGYMPVACVQEFIDAHGGMIDGELPSFAPEVQP